MTKARAEWLAFKRAQQAREGAVFGRRHTDSWDSTHYLEIIDEQVETIQQLNSEIKRLELLFKTALARNP